MKSLLRDSATIVGAIVLALFVYAMLAMPGFMSDRDSTVPASRAFAIAGR